LSREIVLLRTLKVSEGKNRWKWLKYVGRAAQGWRERAVLLRGLRGIKGLKGMKGVD